MLFILLFFTACVASTVSAVVGFGGGVVLLPVLVAVCGAREAVPVLVITQLASNSCRVVLNRREIDLRVVGWFSLGAVPFGVGGGLLFATASVPLLTKLIGGVLILLVIGKRLAARSKRTDEGSDSIDHALPMSERHEVEADAPVSHQEAASISPVMRMRKWLLLQSGQAYAWFGAVSSFLGAVVGTVGPLTVAIFTAFGLTRVTLIGTEALCAVIMHLTKLVTYGSASVLSRDAVLLGAALTPAVMAGSLLGKQLVDRLNTVTFSQVIDAALVLAALLLLIEG